jgi:glycosyltransferase involved in cell wall biosynthesis
MSCSLDCHTDTGDAGHKMKILYISQYFPPEVGAPSARVYEFAHYWSKMGHEVKVLTAFPNHPTGVVPEEYRGRIFQRESMDGIEVVRTWVFAAPNKGFAKRVINYLSFPISAVLLGTPMIDGCDVIIATSPQFFVAAAGYIMSTFKRRKFVFEVRDLWPGSIEAVGAMSNRPVLRILRSIEEFLYRRADKIIAVADSTRDILSGRGVPWSKIHIVPNGADIDFFRPGPKDNHIRRKYGITEDDFVVSYIGTHGMAHGLETVLDAALHFRDNSQMKFCFVGEGAEKERLVKIAKGYALSNAMFIDQQPRELMPYFYQASDICLVPLIDRPLFSAVIPSKMFEIMSCSRPVILSARGESRALLERANAGIAIEPENSAQLVDAVSYLYENNDLANSLGVNGRAFMEEHYSREKMAANYIEVLSSSQM